MQETLFIADIHLDPQRPITHSLFLQFLASRAQHAEALYILGDLFEVWIGDDEDEPVYQEVLIALRRLTDSNLHVSVMPGNRDFLLGQDFVKTTGCVLIPDPTVVDLYGVPTLLMHGDSLCTLDVEYQTFRTQVRHPLWQQQFLAQPLAQRRIFARQARTQSKVHLQKTTEAMMDVTPAAVLSALQTKGVYQLIQGHTHTPAVHQLTVNGQPAYRWVVGDWNEQGTVILSCMPAGCQLLKLSSNGSISHYSPLECNKNYCTL
jgi:UDP-2,3-diacylglucosamine hydrolase